MTSRRAMELLGLVCCLVGSAFGQGFVYVNGATGGDGWNGRCEVWDGATCGPKATIQAGIDAATDGDQVVIADGIYSGVGNKDLDFAGRAITVRSASDNPALCIIDCKQDGRGFYFNSAETAESVVRGLTIRNGNVYDYGGAIYIENASPAIINCTLTGNVALLGGGALHFSDFDYATVINCTIRNNRSYRGGGVWIQDSYANFTNCVIVANAAAERGGGMYCDTFYGKLTNCTIGGNRAASGGGLYCFSGGTTTLTNCILWGDVPEEIYTSSSTAHATYCDVQGGCSGTGNINIDPNFAFAADAHLLPGSPCVDAGTNSPPADCRRTTSNASPGLLTAMAMVRLWPIWARTN